jgi:hypothetical protein
MRQRPVAEVQNRHICLFIKGDPGSATRAVGIALAMDRTMNRLVEETLRPSPADLGADAWSLLDRRRQIAEGSIRRELASRTFELARRASQLEFEDAKAKGLEAPSAGLFE